VTKALFKEFLHKNNVGISEIQVRTGFMIHIIIHEKAILIFNLFRLLYNEQVDILLDCQHFGL
jgi:hypothetical protein